MAAPPQMATTPAGLLGTPRARDRATCWGAGLAAFVVYAGTACRTVYVGDSGEFAAALATFGIVHASGYPLYTILGGVFVRLVPVGSLAFRANLFSGACTAVAVGLLAGLVLDLVRGIHGRPPDDPADPPPGARAAAAGAALLFAFATTTWQEATVARVYGLNSALSLWVFREGCRWAAAPSARTGFRTGLAAGLAMANHLGAAGAVLGALALVAAGRAWTAPGVAAWWGQPWARFCGGCVPGAACYLYLPWRYADLPAVRWKPIEGPGDLLRYILRSDYAHRSWVGHDPLRVARAVAHGLDTVPSAVTWVGAGLAVVGAVWLARRARPVALGLGVFALVYGGLLVWHGQRRDLFLWDRYWLPWHLIAGACAGVALREVIARVRMPTVRIVVALALPLVLIPLHWGVCDRHTATLAGDVSRKILERLPHAAVLAAEEDNVVFPLLYLCAAEGRRPDVRLALTSMQPDIELGSPRREAIYPTAPGPVDPELKVQADWIGLVPRFRLRDMPPWPADAWAGWAVPAAEAATDPAAWPDSHERELVAHYFRAKARTLARGGGPGDPGVRQALARAEAFSVASEREFILTRRAYREIGAQPGDEERITAAIAAISPDVVGER